MAFNDIDKFSTIKRCGQIIQTHKLVYPPEKKKVNLYQQDRESSWLNYYFLELFAAA